MIALFGAFMIMVIILAVLALIVVKALTHSPWGTFTVAATIPIALFMGVYLRYIRPGKIGEVSIIGFVGLMAAIVFGQDVAAHPVLGPLFDFDGKGLTWILIVYGFIASVLPVWLLAPRDYLSTFLKIGTIVGLAIGIVVVAPELKMPALTQFVDGSGPVWSGNLFRSSSSPRLRRGVGFHALISSGTTPKLIENETQARYIGYGGMLMESFVAIMALVAACVIEPGIYYAMNSPAAVIGTTPDQVAQVVSSWGFVITPADLVQTAKDVGESTSSRRRRADAGRGHGAHTAPGHRRPVHDGVLVSLRHPVRSAVHPDRRRRGHPRRPLHAAGPDGHLRALAQAHRVAAGQPDRHRPVRGGLGLLPYQGVVDPLGGINTLWPLFGIANQMLAAIALTLGAVVLFKMKRERYAWVAVLPTLWLLACTLTAGWQKIFAADPKVSFLAHAAQRRHRRRQGAGSGQVAGADVARGAERLHQRRSVRDLHVRGDQHGDFRHPGRARAENRPTSRETPYEPLPSAAAAGAD